MTPPVTIVTSRAEAADELTPSDYRDIYDELRTKGSLRVFVETIGSQYSIAWWSKYERREIELTRQAKQELRQAVSLPPLPLTIAEAAATIDPDATVYQVGEQTATRVVMVGGDIAEPLTLHLNGRVTILDDEPSDDPAPEPGVTPVTTGKAPRKPTKAIRVSPDSFDRLQRLRTDAGMTWDEFAVWVATLCGE